MLASFWQYTREIFCNIDTKLNMIKLQHNVDSPICRKRPHVHIWNSTFYRRYNRYFASPSYGDQRYTKGIFWLSNELLSSRTQRKKTKVNTSKFREEYTMSLVLFTWAVETSQSFDISKLAHWFYHNKSFNYIFVIKLHSEAPNCLVFNDVH